MGDGTFSSETNSSFIQFITIYTVRLNHEWLCIVNKQQQKRFIFTPDHHMNKSVEKIGGRKYVLKK